MAELVPRSPTTSVDRPRPDAAPAGLDVDAGEWNGGAPLDFGSLGSMLPSATSPLIAESAIELTGARRRPDQTYYRRRLVWRAERDRVVVVEVDQRLVPRSHGRFAPDGSWAVTGVHIHVATDCRRRTGEVAHEQPAPAGQGSAGGQPAPATTGLGRNEGDLSYLPRAARASFVRVCPRPTVAVAQAVRYEESSGQVERHTVRALRLDARGAVVIVGSRLAMAPSWQLEQVTYRFAGAGIGHAAPRTGIER